MTVKKIDLIKDLRNKTGVSLAECQKALNEANNNILEAIEILKKRGAQIAADKKDRKTEQGLIDAYIHPNGKIGVLIEINCETDFVAKSDDFKILVHEIALQIAAMSPENIEKLLKQPYIKDENLIIEDLIHQLVVKIKENINIKRFERFEID